MDNRIYSSNNEDSILKEKGPHKLLSSDQSSYGSHLPEMVEVVSPKTCGENTIYGTTVKSVVIDY